jgi:hypothetical protein
MITPPIADAPGDGLADLLRRSAAFDDDVAALLSAAWPPHSQRTLISLAYCRSALEHAVSQRILIEGQLTGTGLSLVRLVFESVIRAAWVLHGAKDDWLAKFSMPVDAGQLDEPQMGPPIPAMLDAVEPHAPQVVSELRKLGKVLKVMHSFVHGGVHAVVHALRGYPDANLIFVLQNRNLLLLILSDVAVIASQKPQLIGVMRAMRETHADCMPGGKAS